MQIAIGIAIGYLIPKIIAFIGGIVYSANSDVETIENCTVEILWHRKKNIISIGFWRGSAEDRPLVIESQEQKYDPYEKETTVTWTPEDDA